VAAFVWIDKRLPQRQPEIGLAPSWSRVVERVIADVSSQAGEHALGGEQGRRSEGSAIEDPVTAPKPAPHTRAARRATC
jgi:hypothetical protein